MTYLKAWQIQLDGGANLAPAARLVPLGALLLTGTAFALSVGTAYAQDNSTTKGEYQEPVNIEEIIVSARRKDEKLLDVPASITAFSSDYLKTQNIQSFTDYATRIPNLSFQYGLGGNLLWAGSRETTIRGVAGTGTTAYYINDTPVPSSVSPLTLNLDRIEVLKGPQGTLFGASSMGGNLRFITRKPSLTESSGALEVQGASTKRGGFDFDGNAQANVILVPDRIGLDVALGYTHDSGFITRRFPDSSGQLISKKGEGRNDVVTGSVAFRILLTDTLEATISGIGQSSTLHGFPATYFPLPDYKPVSYTVDRDRDVQEYSKDRWGIGSFVLNFAGEGLSMVSSTSYFARQIKEREDNTEGSIQYFSVAEPSVDFSDSAIYQETISRTRLFTHEDRLSFDEGTILPGLSALVGLYYQHETVRSTMPNIPISALTNAGIDPDYLGSSNLKNHNSDFALFGELYYELVPNLTVTVGLRKYWIHQKTDASIDTGYMFSPDGISVNPELRNSQSGLIPKAVISYKIGDQGNIYASASKGFRVGGSEQSLPDICSSDLANLGVAGDQLRQYKSDTLWSYEVGAKGRLANGRLSASVAGFQIDWSNIQQTMFLPTCTLSVTTNAGKARIRGGEFELSGRPFANVPLSIQLGLGYTDGILQEPGVLPQQPNTPLPLVPKWTGTISGYYETPISDAVQLFMAADYSYTSSVKVSDGNSGFYTRQPINMVNANIGMSYGRSQVMLFVKNLFDKRLNFGNQPSAGFERQELLGDGSLQRLPRGIVSRPRQIGVQYQLNF